MSQFRANDFNADEDDLVDHVLGQVPQSAPSGDLRTRLFEQTAGALRRRRRTRRVGLITAFAACYIAGIGTMRLVMPAPTAESATQLVAVELKSTDGTSDRESPSAIASDRSGLTDSSDALADPQIPAAVIERLADFVPQPEFRRTVRLAGDRHIEQTGNLDAALRCYSRALDSSRLEELAVAPDDNWLIMALKDARLKEIHHADHDG